MQERRLHGLPMAPAVAHSFDASSDDGEKGHWTVVAVIGLLGLGYIPLGLPAGGFSTSDITFLFLVGIGLKYKIFTTKFGLVEYVGTALALWFAVRMCLFAPLEGSAVGLGSLRDSLTVFAGLIAYRLAKLKILRKAIVRGVTVSLGIALFLEAYQLFAGLPHLLSMGYEAPLFNYNTASGTYRPFGGFFTPVIFGTYLSMAILFVAFSRRGFRWRIYSILAIVGLVFTYTRSAWIGFTLGAIAGFMTLSSSARSKSIRTVLPLLWVIALVLLAFPIILEAPISRFLTVFDANYESNSIRIELWYGTLQAVQHKPVIGYGNESFSAVLHEYVGSMSEFGHAHSTFGAILFKYGIVGIILYVALLVIMLKLLVSLRSEIYAYKSLGVAVFVSFVVASLAETTWGSFQLIVLLFLAAGLAKVNSLPSRANSEKAV